MPFFDDDPIDPDLNLKGDIGPGLDNNKDDKIKVSSAIEKRTGAAPYAELGKFGESLANKFSKSTAKKRDKSLTPGFLGATMAAQIKKGEDPDGVILKDGPTRDALKRKDSDPNTGSLFGPIPKITAAIGPNQPNRQEDIRKIQGKLATTGYAPRFTEKPLTRTLQLNSHDPKAKAQTIPHVQKQQSAGQLGRNLNNLLNGVLNFQRAKGLKQDALVKPGGPTAQALDKKNGKARQARVDQLNDVTRKVLDSEHDAYKDITNRNAAESMAGLIVGT